MAICYTGPLFINKPYMSGGVTLSEGGIYSPTETNGSYGSDFNGRLFRLTDHFGRRGREDLARTWPDQFPSDGDDIQDMSKHINAGIGKLLAAVQNASLVPINVAQTGAQEMHNRAEQGRAPFRCSTLSTENLIATIRATVDHLVAGSDDAMPRIEPAVSFDEEDKPFDEGALMNEAARDVFRDGEFGDLYGKAAQRTLAAFARGVRYAAHIGAQDFLYDTGRPWLKYPDDYEPVEHDGPVVNGFHNLMHGEEVSHLHSTENGDQFQIAVHMKDRRKLQYKSVYVPVSPLDRDREYWISIGKLEEVRQGRIPLSAELYSTLDPRKLIALVDADSAPARMPLYTPFVFAKTAPGLLQR